MQVLSSSVANALEYFNDGTGDTSETQKFVKHFDRFFDCLNVRSMNECIQRRKPDLRPYRDPSDNRLKVHGLCYFTGCLFNCLIALITVAKGGISWLLG